MFKSHFLILIFFFENDENDLHLRIFISICNQIFLRLVFQTNKLFLLLTKLFSNNLLRKRN